MPGILSFGRSSSANDPNHVTVEMNQQPSHAHQRDRDRDASEQGPSHGRDASARSIFSNISIPSLATMRQRERENEMLRQMARADASANRLPSPTPAQLEAGTLNPQAAAAASVGAGPGPGPPALPPAPLVTPPAPATNKSARSRREREEAATLFGPNLANYFGSGNSSSGAIAAPTATASNTTSTPPTLDTTAAASNLNSRRARLGSRGRVRGASLSGLSMMSLGAESVNSLGGVALSPNDNGAVSAGIMDGSTHDLISQVSQVTKDNNVSVDQVAMSEGVDIETLSRWIEKCAGSYPNQLGAEPSPIPSVTPVCTTLQSYVNLKRNTVRLKIRTDEENRASTQSDKGTQEADLGPLGPDKHRGLASSSDVNLLRSAPSLSVLPGTACTSAFKDVAASSGLPDPTHSLLFDFDCAAPCASVQVFVRASRKHGSWLNFTPPADGLADTLPDGTPALLAQRGPPPHVLGWPVHVARLGKGFSVGHKVSLPLHLKYYAPPLAAKAGAGAGAGAAAVPEHEPEQEQQINSVSAAHGSAKVGESAIPETPAWEMQRRLELELEEQEEESRMERMRRIRQSNANSDGRAGAAYAGPTPAAGGLQATEANANSAAPEENANAPAIPAEETKEQRLAREKAERETLKIAVVVEALDENARPLREPNLQTTYLRVTSLPARQPPAQPSSSAEGVNGGEASGLPVPARVWTAQVEGQECEIGPHRFQLQELYGLSTKPPPVRAAAEEGGGGDEEGTAGPSLVADMDDSNGSECLICLSAPPTTLLLPCTHGLCLECAIQLRESVMGMRQSERRRGRTPRRKYACPVCRRGFTSMLHLSKADEKLVAQAEAQAQAQAQA